MLILGHWKGRLIDGISLAKDNIIKDRLIDGISLETVMAKGNKVGVVGTKIVVDYLRIEEQVGSQEPETKKSR